jgi:hypothetical protein
VRPHPDVGEVHLVAAHQQLDTEDAAAAQRVDDARGDRLRRVERRRGQLLRLRSASCCKPRRSRGPLCS